MTSFDTPRTRITASFERLRALWLLWSIVVGCISVRAEAETTRALLIVGDSLSAGYGIGLAASWPAVLAKRLEREGYPYQVVNASISGETTAGGARRLGALLAEHHPAVVVIALGANDALRGIDPAATRANLERMLGAVEQAGAVAMLCQVRVPPNYGAPYADAFEALYPALAQEHGRLLAPFLLEGFAADPAAFQADGLHPLASMQPRIVDTLWPTLRAAMAAAKPEDRRR